MLRSFRRALLGGSLSLFAMTCVADARPEPFVIDDIYRLQDLGTTFRFTADGTAMAFMVRRPVRDEIEQHYIFSNDRSDIWLYDRATGTSRNITEGARDHASFWYPSWSPSGKKLAMVSTRGASDGRAHVWIWDRATGESRQLGEQFAGIDNDAMASEADHKLYWLSESQLVFPSIPATLATAEPRTNREFIRIKTAQWQASLQGRQPTAAVFESGIPLSREQLSQGQGWVSCNVASNRCEQLLDSHLYSYMHEYLGSTTVPSPEGTLVATLAIAQRPKPDPARPLGRYTGNVYGLDFFDQNGRRVFQSLRRMTNVALPSLRWSPDGRRLAFIGSYDPQVNLADGKQCVDTDSMGIYVLDTATDTLEKIALPALRPGARQFWGMFCRHQMSWIDNRRLLLAAEKLTPPSATGAARAESGWWVLDGKAAPRNLTATLDFVPERLYPALDGRAWLFARNGNLWLLSTNGAVKRLTSHPDTNVAPRIHWTDADESRGGRVARVVYDLQGEVGKSIAKNAESASALYRLDLRQGESKRIPLPSDRSTYFSFSGANDAAVLVDNDRTGTRVWLSAAGAASAKQVFQANLFLNDIAEGELRSFDYVSLRGEPLKAWLVLPVGYQPGRRYPMVTWVYQSLVQTAQPPRLASISMLNPLNLQTLASRGYAVLLPSMPGLTHDYKRLTTGVLPAIDKAVEMGIADPDRLAVMGQSNGGFSTYGLITQTNRFKAAIALAGMTDFSSIAMEFEGDYLGPGATEVGLTYGRFDVLETRMEFGLPWNSLVTHRNSPISHVDFVQTPLLQLHGDHDGVPIAQAQEFFTAMQRLGKRARLVEYIGDDHVLQSPANARHSWEQIFEWLAEYVR
jgi:dipeptidyl aminopeptidase/acylaminoacyl peptidase